MLFFVFTYIRFWYFSVPFFPFLSFLLQVLVLSTFTRSYHHFYVLFSLIFGFWEVILRGSIPIRPSKGRSTNISLHNTSSSNWTRPLRKGLYRKNRSTLTREGKRKRGRPKNRDLKIAGREEPGRLPEVNSHWQACARELLSGAFAVVVSSPLGTLRSETRRL